MRYTELLKTITPHARTLVMVTSLLLAGSLVMLANPLIAGKLTQTVLEGSQVSGMSVRAVLIAWLACKMRDVQ